DKTKGSIDKQLEQFRIKPLTIEAFDGFKKDESSNNKYMIRTIINEPVFLKKTKTFSTGLLFKIDDDYKFVFKLDSKLLDASMELLTREWRSTDNGELRIHVKNDYLDHCIIKKYTPIIHIEVVKISSDNTKDTNIVTTTNTNNNPSTNINNNNNNNTIIKTNINN